MSELKREYVVPLRRKTRTAPNWRRGKKAVSVLREFIQKHMKTDDVVICNELNEAIWSRGIKHPPGKVSVIAHRIDVAGKEKTLVNLVEVGVEQYLKAYKETPMPQEEVKEEKASKTKTKKEEAVEAEVKETPKTEAKKETKAEAKAEVKEKKEEVKDE